MIIWLKKYKECTKKFIISASNLNVDMKQSLVQIEILPVSTE